MTRQLDILDGHRVQGGSRALRDEYPMLGLARDAFPYRRAGGMFGTYGSIVLTAPCNFACPYCDAGGYAKDAQSNLPNWRNIPTAKIMSFVETEVQRGRVIYLSGGEPLMFPELVLAIGRLVRDMGGYCVVCTNASQEKRLHAMTNCVDEFSISLKGTREIAERISGINGPLAFLRPHRNALGLIGRGVALEFVVVMFVGLDVDNLCEIYEPFIRAEAHVVLKEYRPKVTRINDDHSYSTIIDPQVGGIEKPLSVESIREIYAELLRRYPDQAHVFTMVLGGGGDQVIVNSAAEHRLTR